MRGVGWREFEQLRDLQETAEQFGFKLVGNRYRNDNGFSLQPLGDQLPSYTRDAELWSGDMDEIRSFLGGLQFASEYYKMHLKLFTDKRLERKEQDIRNKQLADMLRQPAIDPEDDIPF